MTDVKDLAAKYGVQSPGAIEQENLILLIEDQTDMRLIMAHHLNKLGFKNIRQFANGHEALMWMRLGEQKVSMTICDHEMPVMNGFDFLEELKFDVDLTRGPFSITIDNPNREKIMLATESGVDGVMVKPFTLKDIIPKLKEAYKIYHNPNNPELLYEKAKEFLKKDDLDTAKSIYEGLMAVTEKAARPLVGLAQGAQRKKDYKNAEDLLKQAEERNKNYVHLYVERGELFAAQNKTEEAVEQFKIAIKLSPLNQISISIKNAQISITSIPFTNF